jgi:hypothetical protein
VRISGLWLHVFQVDDAAIVGNKRGGERKNGVLHPETLLARRLEHEQHALALGHFAAVHQTDLVLLRGQGDLNVHLVNACR